MSAAKTKELTQANTHESQNRVAISIRVPKKIADYIENYATQYKLKKTDAYLHFIQEGISAQGLNAANAAPTLPPTKTLVVLVLKHVCQMYDAIDKAILFGSYARGDQRPGSDCDVRLVINRDKSFTLRDVGDFSKRIRQILDIDCDIITTKEIKNEQLKRAIQNEGETIYERSLATLSGDALAEFTSA
jgi:predicted nucleotidyltransferase